MSGESRETFERDRCGQTGEDMRRSDPILDKLRVMHDEMGALLNHKCHIIEYYQECGDCRKYNRLDASYTKWCLSYVAGIFAREKHPSFRESSSLMTQGAESADIGKLDTADKKCAYCKHTHTFQFDEIVDDDCPVVGCPCMHFLGSAETGGEKAATELRSLIQAIENCAIADSGPNGVNADTLRGTLVSAKAALANFPRNSQNQTVSSGVEGAHEGTTADKSGSREPEKFIVDVRPRKPGETAEVV